jgi:hypothetical protein
MLSGGARECFLAGFSSPTIIQSKIQGITTYTLRLLYRAGIFRKGGYKKIHPTKKISLWLLIFRYVLD